MNRRRPARGHRQDRPVRCNTCGTLSHPTRAAARQFMLSNGMSAQLNIVYACPAAPGRFHIGDPADTRPEGAPMSTIIDATPEVLDTAAEMYANGASAALELLLTDLSTYRYLAQVPVSPALARRLIELNADNNRNHANSRSDIYARDMRPRPDGTSNWRPKTGQTLKLDTDGRMIDGLHRTHAVIKAETTIVFDLCFGIDPRDIVVVDAHKPRSDADIIKTAHGTDLYRTAALVKWVWAHRRGAYFGANAQMRPTSMEIRETYEADALLFDAATKRGLDCSQRGLVAPTVAAVAYFLMAEIDKEETERFYDVLISGLYGVTDPSKMAIYHLRERLIRRKQDRLSRGELLALFVRAWNRRHENVTKLQISRDELTVANFPQLGK